jgi:hypothetical protein
VLEGELREREPIGVAPPLLLHQLLEPFEGALRVRPEALAQVPAVKDVLAEEAGRPGVQRALRQLAADDAR